MDIQDLAKRKTELMATLTAISMWNVLGASIEDLTKTEILKIETHRELSDIQKKIDDYVSGKTL